MTQVIHSGHVEVTVDVVLFTIVSPVGDGDEDDGERTDGLSYAADLRVLLIRRPHDPFGHTWALPGGFLAVDETLEAAATRELAAKTGVRDIYLEQLYTFGALNRDPRARVISVAYYALVRGDLARAHGGPDPADPDAGWFSLAALPENLAFDHADILTYARQRLRAKATYAPIAFEFLPGAFTLSQLRAVHEAIAGRPLDKRNFNRAMLASGYLCPTGNSQRATAHRPARLYRADASRLTADRQGERKQANNGH